MISRDDVKMVFSVFLFDYCSFHMLLTENILIHKYIFSYAQALSFAINVCTHLWIPFKLQNWQKCKSNIIYIWSYLLLRVHPKHTNSQKLFVACSSYNCSNVWDCFIKKSLFCSPRLNAFDKKNCNIVKYDYHFKYVFSIWIYFKV